MAAALVDPRGIPMRRIVPVVSLAIGMILVPMSVAAGVAGATGSNNISAGYIAHFGVQTISLHGSVNVPVAKCLNKQGLDGYLTTTFGLGGSSGGGYEQISTTCPDGTPVYEATVINSIGASVSESLSAGDTVTFAATVSSTSESYTLTDSRSGSLSLTGPGFGADEAEALQEAQAGPFPKFAELKFGPISVNHATWAQLDPTGFNQVDGQTVQLKVSTLRRSGAFHVKYVSQG
jgi:hypothetical protein